MPRSLTRNLRRPGALPALAVALSLILWAAAVRLVYIFMDPIGELASDQVEAQSQAMDSLARLPLDLAKETVPLALGVFVSLWMLAPVAGELGLRFVVARAALAAGVGAVFASIVGFIIGLIVLAPIVMVMGLSVGARLPSMIIGSATGTISTWLSYLPLVTLAVVFLWLWLRDREPKHPVAGIIDEV